MKPDSGSFRDPANRVYALPANSGDEAKRILRGINQDTLDNYQKLAQEPFYQDLIDSGRVVKTELLMPGSQAVDEIMADGWSAVLEHEVIPFVSYPYEWTFSMLKDAALLQLYIIEKSLEHGWTLKDATPYNIQWIGSRPVFIDIPSFEPWVKGEPWVGYRQFCSMFLTPLMLRAHLGIDHLPLLRSYLDGIPPMEAARFFTGIKRFKKGVMSHVIFPAMVENSIAKRERNDVPAKRRAAGRQSEAMVLGLVQSLTRLVRKLSAGGEQTDWSHYDTTHSYEDADFEKKKVFVGKQAAKSPRNHVWDIGCNTGTFSRISSEFCKQVIAMDGDHNAVDRLYCADKNRAENDGLEKRAGGSKILPLAINIANISPAQGWAGRERSALDQRKKPDLVLCLALIHHVRMSANIPNVLFLQWLRSLDADVVIEFVNRSDEMVVKLLTNKKEQYEDYNLEQFITEAEQFFTIGDRESLKNGKREIFFLSPR